MPLGQAARQRHDNGVADARRAFANLFKSLAGDGEDARVAQRHDGSGSPNSSEEADFANKLTLRNFRDWFCRAVYMDCKSSGEDEVKRVRRLPLSDKHLATPQHLLIGSLQYLLQP